MEIENAVRSIKHEMSIIVTVSRIKGDISSSGCTLDTVNDCLNTAQQNVTFHHLSDVETRKRTQRGEKRRGRKRLMGTN